MALTAKVVEAPWQRVRLEGADPIETGVLTVSVAAVESTLPHELVARQK